MPTFYVGRVGSMRALFGPTDGLDASATWFGGVHRSLSGTPTVDRLGRKRSWEMSWPALVPEDHAFVVALGQGTAGSPLRLIDANQRNRCSPQHSSGGTFRRSTEGFTVSTGTLGWQTIPVPDSTWSGLLEGGLGWIVPTTVGGILKTSTVADDRYPLITGEQVTASVWVSGNLNARVQLIPYDSAGAALTAISGGTTALAGLYTRLTVTHTPLSTQVSAVLAVDIPAGQGAGVAVATAWQLEAAAAAAQWVPGEGCPVVVVDQASDRYPLYPYHEAGLTLLEV